MAIYTRAKGYRAYRVKTPQLHDRQEFYQRHCKTDPLDSKAGAQMPDEVLEELYLPDRHYMALERATRQQEKLTFPLQREKLRIAAIVDGFISGLPRACGQPFSLPARLYQIAFDGAGREPTSAPQTRAQRHEFFKEL